jgi:hypothetical protein
MTSGPNVTWPNMQVSLLLRFYLNSSYPFFIMWPSVPFFLPIGFPLQFVRQSFVLSSHWIPSAIRSAILRSSLKFDGSWGGARGPSAHLGASVTVSRCHILQHREGPQPDRRNASGKKRQQGACGEQWRWH